MVGYVYFLTNRSMPGLVKIGYTTTSVDERVRKLNSTGVPSSFELCACFRVAAPSSVERKIHELLREHRYTENREFFVGTVSMLLAATVPLLLEACTQELSNHSPQSQPSSPALDEQSIFLLQLLTGDRKEIGYLLSQLEADIGESELFIESKLATLKQLRLVAEGRATSGYGSQWRITSAGVKFLFDNGHVADYMHQRRGA